MEKKRFLEEALSFAGITKLPDTKTKVIEESFIGSAIISIEKVGGKIVYGIGQYSKDHKTVLVTKDFDKKMVERVIDVYPYESQLVKGEVEEFSPKQALKLKRAYLAKCGYPDKIVNMVNNQRADNFMDEIQKLQAELATYGVKAEDKMVKDLREQLEKIKLEKEQESKE